MYPGQSKRRHERKGQVGSLFDIRNCGCFIKTLKLGILDITEISCRITFASATSAILTLDRTVCKIFVSSSQEDGTGSS